MNTPINGSLFYMFFFVWLFCQSNCTNKHTFQSNWTTAMLFHFQLMTRLIPSVFELACFIRFFCLFYDSAFNRFSSFDIGKLQKYGAFATIIYSNDGYCCGCGMIMLWWNCGSFVRFENNKMFMMSKYMIYTFTLH